MVRHIPPLGESIIMHRGSSECECKPTKQVKHIQRSSGRRGSHQGYRLEVSYQHNILEAV